MNPDMPGRRVAILLGSLAHRRLINTFKDLPSRYQGIVAAARCVTPIGGEPGLPVCVHLSLRDITRRIPKLRHRIPADSNEYLFGLYSTLSNADIILSHWASAAFSFQAARYSRKAGVPLILHEVESVPLVNYGRSTYRAKRFAIETSRLIIAVTERARATLLVDGVPEKKIQLIPYGVDTDMFHPSVDGSGIRKELGCGNGEVVVLYAGRISWPKGSHDLVSAIKLLSAESWWRKVKVRVVLAGLGPDYQEIRERIGYLGLSETFSLVGSVRYDDMPGYYAACDMLLAPSRPDGRTVNEQFGLTLCEAMATGKPVLGTYCGGIPEVIGDSGLLVQPGDPLTLAGAIRDLVQNESLRHELGEAGRARVLERFDSKVVSQQCAEVFDEVSGG